jgi:hypothetical protein
MRKLAMLAVALLSAACAMQMDVPEGFLRLKAREVGDVRAVTADDARIWVREFNVDQGASLEFWLQALRSDLEQSRGYRLEPKDQEVVDTEGHKGRRIEGSIAVGGEVRGYMIAVFSLSETKLRVAEFSARQELFAKHIDAVRKAVLTAQ